MDIAEIRALAKLLAEYGLTAAEVRDGKQSVRLERAAGKKINSEEFEEPAVIINENEFIEIKSPIVGVFYVAASPEAEPFVTIGGKVKPGDVLCIIEAMKLLNEITSEHDGEIADICLKNGDIAEFGQTLFKMRRA